MKSKTFIADDLILLYNSRFQKFPSKFKLHWIGSYKIKIAHDYGSFEIIDFEGTSFPTRINGYCLKKYHT